MFPIFDPPICFCSAKAFIDEAIAPGRGGKVLVHCNGGISLSPAFVVMFVMQYYSLSWEDALHLVQNRRYCISPNGGFLTQIKEYEAIYRANQAVASYPTAQRTINRRKREDDSDDEDARDEDRKRALVENESSHKSLLLQLNHLDPDAMEIS
ncbi:hypothetical protein PQX77_006239 [Marasmius sp. AFHP31]|nr:hypothetical protein PQX77_006239 [Marasmius sp. AFHP31]